MNKLQKFPRYQPCSYQMQQVKYFAPNYLGEKLSCILFMSLHNQVFSLFFFTSLRRLRHLPGMETKQKLSHLLWSKPLFAVKKYLHFKFNLWSCYYFLCWSAANRNNKKKKDEKFSNSPFLNTALFTAAFWLTFFYNLKEQGSSEGPTLHVTEGKF